MRFFIAALLLFTLTATTFSQIGSDTDHWDWSKDAEHHKALVRVEPKEGTFGTAVLILYKGEPHAMTASHVVDHSYDDEVKVLCKNDLEVSAYVIKYLSLIHI